MGKEVEHFFGTYARIILSDWPALAELLVRYSTPIKVSIKKDKPANTSKLILTKAQIDETLISPFHTFLKPHINAAAMLYRFKFELAVQENEALKEQLPKLDEKQILPAGTLEKISVNQIEKMQTDLNTLLGQQNKQWNEGLLLWKETLVNALEKNGVSLSDLEYKELQNQETTSELLDRFVELNIDLPKTRKSEMTFHKYLTLKIDLSIQSALSRTQKPHAQSDIQKVLKKIKTPLEMIRKQEIQIAAQQKQAVEALIKL